MLRYQKPPHLKSSFLTKPNWEEVKRGLSIERNSEGTANMDVYKDG
jgi:hypothetical protein